MSKTTGIGEGSGPLRPFEKGEGKISEHTVKKTKADLPVGVPSKKIYEPNRSFDHKVKNDSGWVKNNAAANKTTQAVRRAIGG